MVQRLGSLGYIGGTPSGPPTHFVLSLINLQRTIIGAYVKSTLSGVTFLWAGGREWLPTVKKQSLNMHRACCPWRVGQRWESQ